MSTILIVDDTPASRDTVEAMLFREGHELLFAESGWECFEVLEERLPDLILLDVMMPGLTGFEVCTRLKAHEDYTSIPIILLTALNKKEDILKGLESGADEFVSKPVSGPELRARVRNLLKLKSLYDESQKTMEFRDNLTRFLVHDMRNPLVSIRLAAEAGLSAEPNQQEESFRRILKESSQLNNFLNQMLISARAEQSDWQLRREMIDLVELAANCLKRYQERCDIKLEVIDSQPVSISGDRNLLHRVLDNLLSNALKYGDEGSLSVVVRTDEEWAHAEVRDRGPGVSNEVRDELFQKHSTTKGIGLGLFFCRQVCEAHNGRIDYEKIEPHGSLFRVSLPKKAGAEACSTKPSR